MQMYAPILCAISYSKMKLSLQENHNSSVIVLTSDKCPYYLYVVLDYLCSSRCQGYVGTGDVIITYSTQWEFSSQKGMKIRLLAKAGLEPEFPQ